MGLIWVLIIAVFILFIVYVVKGVQQDSSGHDNDIDRLDDPLHVLRLRYARGEIDQEEYERLKKGLEG